MRRPGARKIKTLSLFSGAGGLDIGFHNAGFEILGCVELEGSYARTLQENVGADRFFGQGTNVHCIDIREFDPTPYIDAGIECVIGGPPCQTFSAAGRRSGGVLGTKDSRGRLFESYCSILSALNPRVFVFENVYGLPGANGGAPWREICEAFSSLGYSLRAEVLDSADYGVPQHRERLIIVGFKDDLGDFVFPEPTHGPDSNSGLPLVCAGEAIQDLDSVINSPPLGGLYGHLLPLVPPGLNYAFFTREMGYPKPYFAWRSKFHDFLYKSDPNSPSRTIKAQPGKFTGPFHWDNRHFTIAELKRLQSFPDDYSIAGSFAKVMEQVGNSVPPKLAEVIAISVREQLLRPVRRLTYSKRPADFQSTFRQRQRERTHYFKAVAKKVIAERFPNVTLFEKSSAKAAKEDYIFEYETNFRRKLLPAKTSARLGAIHYKVEEARKLNQIQLKIKPLSGAGRTKGLKLDIWGLEKYLVDVDEMSVGAQFHDSSDLFRIWGIAENALTKRSQFYTLIDIYGHYANRGDTVRIRTQFSARVKTPMMRALEYFGSSENCGRYMSVQAVAEALKVDPKSVDSIVTELRSYRWDVRSSKTHPTINSADVICTYPFPLLSGKAQLERKINE